MGKTEIKSKIQLENNLTTFAKCSKCGGQMKEASFEILNSLSIDFGHALLVGPKKAFYLNPNRRSPILVMVCTKCGYIECYAEFPEGL